MAVDHHQVAQVWDEAMNSCCSRFGCLDLWIGSQRSFMQIHPPLRICSWPRSAMCGSKTCDLSLDRTDGSDTTTSSEGTTVVAAASKTNITQKMVNMIWCFRKYHFARLEPLKPVKRSRMLCNKTSNHPARPLFGMRNMLIPNRGHTIHVGP